jgi:hypothetical protein
MKNNLLLFFLLILGSTALGQKIMLGDSVEICFQKMDSIIFDSSQIRVSITFRNISKRPILVYESLQQGYLKDRFQNINIELEKQSQDKYLYKATMFYEISDKYEFSDSFRHYDLPKIQLSPFKTDTLWYHLMHLGTYFDSGNYRIKINLRVQTIPDTTEYHFDSTGATAPPVDEIKYVSSNWIYFQFVDRKRPCCNEIGIVDSIVTKLLQLPEVRKANNYIDSFTHHMHGVSAFVVSKPNENLKYYCIAVGYNGDLRFETYYNFYVWPRTMMIKYLDTDSGKLLTLAEWRKKRKSRDVIQ